MSLDDAAAAVAGDEPVATNPQTWEVITGYRDALTYVQQPETPLLVRASMAQLNLVKIHP